MSRAIAAAAFLSYLLAPLAARADAVKLSGTWIEDVTVRNIADGRVLYATRGGGEVERPLVALTGLRLNQYPDLNAATAALEQDKHAEAVPLLAKVAGAAPQRDRWVRHWALAQSVAALDRLNRPVEAVEAYLTLAREGGEALYLSRPPTASVEGANAEQKRQVLQRLRQANITTGPAAEHVKRMTELAAAAPPATEAPVQGADPAVPAPAPGAGADAPPSPPQESAVVLARAVSPQDPVGQMLRQGRFEEALAEVRKILDTPTEQIAMRLYQQGVAQLALAEQTRDEKLYKDAGLSFMRVVIHFPRSTQWVGPSLVEAGLVHERIGRPDLAAKLWQKARMAVNPEDEPEVSRRLDELMGVTAEVPQPEGEAAGG